MTKDKFYTLREERANYLSHGLGLLIGIMATGILVNNASLNNNTWGIIAHSLFGLGIIACM